jgi:hypothetical protein
LQLGGLPVPSSGEIEHEAEAVGDGRQTTGRQGAEALHEVQPDSAR